MSNQTTKAIAERFGFNPDLLQRYLNDFGIDAEVNREKLLADEAAELLVDLIFKKEYGRLKNYLDGFSYTWEK